ncbi:YybH family protein [Streptomyces sp. NPDC054949]
MPFSRPEEMHATFAKAMQDHDVDALLDLFEPNAITALPDGTQLTGADARRDMFTGLLTAGTGMVGTQRTALIADEIALTSTTYTIPANKAGAAPTTVTTAEVSRRQPDGSWRVVIDAPAFS